MKQLTLISILVPLLGLIALANAMGASSTPVSLNARVGHQRALDLVWWQNRLWPTENKTPKPALEEVMPEAAIRAKAEESLRLTNALAHFWGQAVTGAQLQAEMERQARDTKQPEVLRALWAALDNDPHLIAEMLARPALVERLARSAYEARNGGERAPSFDSWWEKSRHAMPAAISEPAFAYELPEMAATPFATGSWNPTFALPEADLQATAVWTGVEMIVWGGTEAGAGKFNSGSRYNPATDTWRPTSGFGAPEVRKQHSAVWTGTEMIVWGGCGPLDEHNCEIGSGGRYNPQSDTWLPTSHPGTNRIDHTAIWTGSEMIVWGGCAFVNNVCTPNAVGSDGVRYDPATDTWQTTSVVNAPEPRLLHTAVWTGTQMIVWGGRDGITEPFNTGGRYDPATDTWMPTTLTKAPSPRYEHTAVWTGREMIIWGGNNGSGDLGDGRRYNPVNDRWQPVRPNGAPEGRAMHTAVWSGQEMIVWGGCTLNNIGFCQELLDTGGRYNPRTNTWLPTSQVNAPEARTGHLAVWTGSLMIIWGGDRNALFGSPRTGGRYNPANDSWTPTNANDAPTGRVFQTAVWTGTEMIIWGGTDRFFGEVNTGGRYTAATDSWQPTSLTGAPFGRRSHTAVWSGMEMIIWGGAVGSFITNEGGRYNPASNTWAPTSTTGAPTPRADHSAVWTGSEMIVWGGTQSTNTGGRYNPVANTWTPTTTAGAPMGRSSHTAVWTGQEMIVWGGFSSTGTINSGGRYNPAANAWAPVSLADAPSDRSSHAAVWTGSRMVIWGGSEYLGDTFDFLRDGAQYDPVTNSWTPTSLVSAPSERASFAYVWSGTELIVWAGCNGAADCSDGLLTGGQYNPMTDTWIPTTLLGSPSARFAPTGVWTGSEMIVWGGVADESNTFTNHGGRYTPTSGSDTTPPLITGVDATDLTSTSATIVWTTNEGATSQVEYGLTTAYGSFSPLDPDLVLNHSVSLSGLAPVTLYHYRVHSTDQAGNTSVSGDFTFMTIDTVAIQSAIHCFISGTLSIRATSTDPNATLTAYNDGSGQFIGTLTNRGGGKYSGEFNNVFGLSIVRVESSSGGTAIRVVTSTSCSLRSISSMVALFLPPQFHPTSPNL